MPGYIDPGIGTLPAQRSSRRFFQLWRTSGSLRSIWNTIVPVSVVQRYRSEDEGSHRALTVESWGTANEFSAVYVGTDITSGGENYIIEIDALNSHRLCPAAVSPFPVDLHLFTPLNPYNPVSTLSPFGIYTPGLFLDPSFTEGTFIGFGGSNPSLPSYVGLTLEKFDSVMSAARWYANHTETLLTFDPPLRIYPGSGICLQMRSKVVTQPIYLNATFLYREIFTTSGIEPT